MATSRESELIAQAEAALRAADESAFLAPPRVVRRVIKQDANVAGWGTHTPHRKSYVIPRERLLPLVAHDELTLDPERPIPERVILLARPDDHDLSTLTLPELLLRLWRMLYHSRVHAAFDELLEAGRLTTAALRARIDRIGQVEFDEISSVLRQENYLLDPTSRAGVYVEFAAVYQELRHFAPSLLPTYFPSIDQFERIDEVLDADVDGTALFEQTRLQGALEPRRPEPEAEPSTDPSPRILALPPAAGRASERAHARWLRRADGASLRGNSVRAAILRTIALRYASDEQLSGTAAAASLELERLLDRLRAALGFDEEDAGRWRGVLGALLANSSRGFWNADRRLLYDLQRVCTDYERDIYVVDLVEWALSFGRRPIKRPLPTQREVLMSKHLHRAAARIPSVRLTDAERRRLADLLLAGTRSASEQLRQRLRPVLEETFDAVGLVPRNAPESIARHKDVEELLDGIVQRGYLTMGQVRDTLSRNNLKLEDLSGLSWFWQGDQLLKMNKRLAYSLDGVYHRGEFYLRWLQTLSSIAFGTPLGRFLTQFVVLPFGGAFVVLEAVEHLVLAVMSAMAAAEDTGADAAHAHELRLLDWNSLVVSVALLGLFFMGLMHLPAFRRFVVEMCRSLFRGIRRACYDIPLWVLRLPPVQALLHSRPFVLFRQFVLNPVLLTALASGLLRLFSAVWPPWTVVAGIFLVCELILNSRTGRDLGELGAEWAEYALRRVGWRLFVSLFEFVMGAFKRILNALERLLYAVDEWLRFRSGESDLMLAAKAVLGLVWAMFAYVIRFAVTLLIEPQINPIKHFPVVTVSHKIILPMAPFGARLLAPTLGKVFANTVAGTTAFLLPGVFGFLVWELKENWRLYAANRRSELQPVVIGEHGETLIRLMKPGFHSGVLPKLYGKLRRARRKAEQGHEHTRASKYVDKLQHLEEAIRRFVERDLLSLLHESRTWDGLPVEVGEIEIASNSLRIELRAPTLSQYGMWIAFQEQSGWLAASVLNAGWLVKLDGARMAVLSGTLTGFYRKGGVDLVREQIDACFEPRHVPYDITANGLTVWPDGRYELEITYNLDQRPLLTPRPRAVARSLKFQNIDAKALIFSAVSVTWDAWVEFWNVERQTGRIPPLTAEPVRVLPLPHVVPMSDVDPLARLSGT